MRTEERTIGGFKFRMTQVGAETGEEIVLRLSRPVAALFGRAVAKGRDASPADLLEGIAPALHSLRGSDLRFVRKKLAERTVIFLPDGKNLRDWPLVEHYDSHFAGRYSDAFAWLRWGVELNAFFGVALARLEEAIRKRASRSSSPLVSPGGPGDSSSPPMDAHA